MLILYRCQLAGAPTARPLRHLQWMGLSNYVCLYLINKGTRYTYHFISGDVERKQTIQTWTVGAGVPNQQVGGAWGPEGDIVSLSMSGAVNVFDQRKGNAPSRLLFVSFKTLHQNFKLKF